MARTALRGRSDVMSQALTALHRAARTGQGALVVVSGEPGIGKSAILRAVVEQASRAGFTVGSGKAESGGQIAPGAPLLVALRSGPHPLLLGDAFTSLAPLYDQPLWLVDRISALLEELAVHGPVLVAIDDLQWSDRLTRFALRVLPARLAGSPVVWLLASRWAPSAAVDEVIGGTDDVTTLTRIALGPLETDDIVDIAADRLGSAPSAAIRGLLNGVGGNPFWAVQVIEGLARRRERGEDVGDLYAELSVGVRSRLDEVAERTVALIRLVAVWGRALPFGDAGRLLGGVSEADVRVAARDAVDNGLLRTAADSVFFPHDLVRETVYMGIAPGDRRLLHRTCARHVVGNGGSVLAAANHFRSSAVQDDEEAVLALDQAARDCMVSMPDHAAELAQQAFALTSESHPSWLTAGERAVETLVNVQREAEALAIADRLLEVAVEPEIVARLELQACRALWCLGDVDEMARRSVRALQREGVSDVMRSRLSGVEALAATRTGSASRAETMARSALAQGRRIDDAHTQRLAMVALIEAARNEGRHRLALDHFAGLRRLSNSAYEIEEIRTLQHLDRYDEAEAMLAKLREAHDDVNQMLPSILYAQMWQDLDLGRIDGAEAGARTLLRLADETGNNGFRLTARMVLAAVATHRGEHADAAVLLGDGDVADVDAPRLRLIRGWLTAGSGDAHAGLAILGPLLEAVDEMRDPWPWSPPWMRLLSQIGVAAGDRRFARTAGRIADIAARRNPGVASLAGTARHVQGLLADDPVALADAVRILRGSPRPLLLADALTDLGAVLLTANRADEGVAAVVEAAEIYRRCGAVAGTRAVGRLLRSHGVRGVRINPTVSRPPTGWDALTPTEVLVVDLISAGHTNRSAAAELGVSPNTVNTHLRAVFRKLDVTSRVQLTIAHREHVATRDPAGPADRGGAS